MTTRPRKSKKMIPGPKGSEPIEAPSHSYLSTPFTFSQFNQFDPCYGESLKILFKNPSRTLNLLDVIQGETPSNRMACTFLQSPSNFPWVMVRLRHLVPASSILKAVAAFYPAYCALRPTCILRSQWNALAIIYNKHQDWYDAVFSSGDHFHHLYPAASKMHDRIDRLLSSISDHAKDERPFKHARTIFPSSYGGSFHPYVWFSFVHSWKRHSCWLNLRRELYTIQAHYPGPIPHHFW